MRPIIPGITDLNQYVNLPEGSFKKFRPENCPNCGGSTLHHHGHYERKADRENTKTDSLNPIFILRFYCPKCHHTCSVLPECIPPRRWYSWLVQQLALTMCLSGATAYAAAQQIKPRDSTLRRWLSELKQRHQEFQAYLKARFSALGYYAELQTFWQQALQLHTLSHIMFYLNADGVIVP